MIFYGNKIKGNGIGKNINIPTINLIIEKKLNEFGVFLVLVDNKFYAIMHHGKRPTITDETINTEIHFSKKIDSLPSFEFLEKERFYFEIIDKIRDTKKFNNLKDLKKQIEIDIMLASKIIKKYQI